MKNIKSIEIKNSPFFENLKIHFSEKMNCIMGGRGTGKSSILYFLKSALSIDSQKGKINDILKSNLGMGEIIIEIESEDGSLFRIVKTFNEEPQPYKLPNQDYIAIARIFDEIECDFYETNQIEEIGRSATDRLYLIDKKIKDSIYEFIKVIRKIQIDLDANAQDIKISNFRINQIKDSLLQYENIEEELKEFRNSEPIDIQPDEKLEFENADFNEKKRTDEKRFFIKATSLYSDLQNQLVLFRDDLEENFESAILNVENFFNKDLILKNVKVIQSNNKSVIDKLREINQLLKSNSQLLNENYGEVEKAHEYQQAEFVTLKQKFDKNRDYFNKYNVLTNRLKDKETLELEVVERELKRKRFIDERKFMIDKFNEVKNDIFSLRLSAVQEINTILAGDVKITLKFSGIVYEFEERLRDALKGSGLKYNELVNKIVETFKPDHFARIIQEKDVETLKVISGIDEYRSIALINALYDTEEIYKIESTYCDDLPDFKLKIEGDTQRENYKNSDELSMGQRCTTVLPIIFAVSNNPLIIDQPEDNLDNKYISEKIHNIIRDQKENRQLVFITHNPNIPVLSDSEYNLFLNYENKRSKKIVEGNVDGVKDDILKILEGGEKAFKTRKEKYKL
ncbi:AAA family ATPase [Flavobacterium sp. Fl-77]|uniref:AAA family ATPase n=1 Tax=Flavobacterium flavipigmentatum TaxID=2893884 RepID=A0AAJ2VYT4_9FLAO|nr:MULTISPECIES: AAA family ATPase [unclassified Flavobacterium]MDX6183990.1 AAA family ATPase [Flavobacterium sp. Fl-33]MDX6187543.1 AAA family ATPase [Flavobacterium sp. Fl-77]UFH38436.1 AAA family ATPase [Flavobacterium sp. F-70]